MPRSLKQVKSGWIDRLAPLVFVLVWSTGFIGARIGTRYAAPFTVLAIRLSIASIALALLTVAFKSAWPRQTIDYRRSVVIGILLHAGYLGGTFVAVDLGLPVSVSALVVSLQPVLVAALSKPVLGEQLIIRQWVGVALGLIGVIIVLTPGLMHQGATTYSVGAVTAAIVSLLSTTTATLMQKRYGGSIPMLAGTSVQYAAAAIVLVIAAALFETTSRRHSELDDWRTFHRRCAAHVLALAPRYSGGFLESVLSRPARDCGDGLPIVRRTSPRCGTHWPRSQFTRRATRT